MNLYIFVKTYCFMISISIMANMLQSLIIPNKINVNHCNLISVLIILYFYESFVSNNDVEKSFGAIANHTLHNQTCMRKRKLTKYIMHCTL